MTEAASLESFNQRYSSPYSRVVVAVSGGPDSMCLLHVLRTTTQWELIVVHFHHGLRKSANQDADCVRMYCDRYQLRYIQRRLPVQLFSRRYQKSIELAGRLLRKAYLAYIARRYKACVATGHHMNDHAETFLMQMVRGAKGGLGRIRSTSYFGNVPFYKPLSDLSKVEILQILDDADIHYVNDETNDAMTIVRNRYRHQVLPLLTELNPKVVDHLMGFSSFIHTLATSFEIPSFDVHILPGYVSVSLPADKWTALNHAQRAEAWQKMLRQLKRSLLSLKQNVRPYTLHFDDMNELTHQQMGVLLNDQPSKLNVNGHVTAFIRPRDVGMYYHSKYTDTSIILPLSSSRSHQTKGTRRVDWTLTDSMKGTTSLYMDLPELSTLTIRNVSSTDTIRPLGHHKNVSVMAYLKKRQVPKSVRDSYPVVVNQDQVIGIPYFTIDQSVAITERTLRIVEIMVQSY